MSHGGLSRSSMFSQFVTAAKGLFSRQDSDESSPKTLRPTTTTTTNSSSSGAPSENTSKMVTATRQRKFPAEKQQSSTEPEVNGSNGKRKSEPVGAEPTETQSKNKRRKRSSLEATTQESQSKPSSNKKSKKMTESTEEPEQQQEEEKKPSAAPAPKKHFRFDSEEPEIPEVAAIEETTEAQQDEDDDSSDDDEAPETVDNSAQLSKMRMEAKKQERARQIEEQLKRDKRKQLDELRKSQAKLAKKKEAKAEDLLSESTETLQGITTQDARRSALPALLPDDILNAAPDVRPPTPPAEERSIIQKKPNKLRFLDKKEKPPKDARVGDVTIRVLDDGVSKNPSKTVLPPKASKTGRNAKQNWLNKSRNTGALNGLRRTTGGSSGFVRK
ncbi:uncharacterized protein BO87DRAFT_375143 [Aspergillus neoniger CBS 115656]|uniref:Immediate-early protein n=1 Tax=Aspergillus neoniger (strain CBS 115656) TaxID=1448310 RepID=A0A318YW63_ASPNB|nr:hypothetical protein BO87DRAFT_375143 [Aspergillus neoniger CBS 115656]PYH36130.1 hypothetical protein BO87DRAFT_375143 [Aspergillus neoniger CBS 115656]